MKSPNRKYQFFNQYFTPQYGVKFHNTIIYDQLYVHPPGAVNSNGLYPGDGLHDP